MKCYYIDSMFLHIAIFINNFPKSHYALQGNNPVKTSIMKYVYLYKMKRNLEFYRQDVLMRYIPSTPYFSRRLNNDVTLMHLSHPHPPSKPSKNKQPRSVYSSLDYRADINHPLIIIFRRPTFQYIAQDIRMMVGGGD